MADKQAMQERLEELKDEYAKTKDNKATNKYVGLLRAKMAKLRKALAERKSKKGTGFSIKKSGDATVVLVGFPNAGKELASQQADKGRIEDRELRIHDDRRHTGNARVQRRADTGAGRPRA